MTLDSLRLDTATWDFDVDDLGNWATCGDATPSPATTTGPEYRMAQDVATRCMAWRGEVYYDTLQGVPYDALLGTYNVPLLQSYLQTEALKVAPVTAAQATISLAANTRIVSGLMYVTDAQGNTAVVSI